MLNFITAHQMNLKLTPKPAVVQRPTRTQAVQAGRAITFDLDSDSSVCLNETLPEWKFEAVDGQTTATIASSWTPAGANLLILQPRGDHAATLDLCRFLVKHSQDACEVPSDGGDATALDMSRDNPSDDRIVPLVILIAKKDEHFIESLLQAGAQSWLMLPLQSQSVTELFSQLFSVLPLPLNQQPVALQEAKSMGRWADDGGQ